MHETKENKARLQWMKQKKSRNGEQRMCKDRYCCAESEAV